MTHVIGPWSQTHSGRAFPLLNPRPEDIDFENDVALQLARQPRFNGATTRLSGGYSIAQHCVLGADYLYWKTYDKKLAAYFLLHDAHEYILGDITTPVLEALTELGNELGVGDKKFGIAKVVYVLKNRIDKAVYEKAGLALPDAHTKDIIKNIDLRMLVTEKRDLMPDSAQPWNAVIENTEPLPLVIHDVWAPEFARATWLRLLQFYLPGVE